MPEVKFKFLVGQKVKVMVTDNGYTASGYVRYFGAWLLKCRLKRKIRILKRAVRAVNSLG
jgi:hypothetical protein